MFWKIPRTKYIMCAQSYSENSTHVVRDLRGDDERNGVGIVSFGICLSREYTPGIESSGD